MRPSLVTAFAPRLEDKGVTPDLRECPLTGRVQLHFHGVPVLLGRVNEDNTAQARFTEAWALKLNGPSGIRILHIGGDSQSYGIQVEPRTTTTQAPTNSSATTRAATDINNATRGVEVFGVYSLLVPEVQSVARLTRIPLDDPFTTP